MNGLENLIQNLGNMLPFLKQPAFWLLWPMFLFFLIKLFKMVYRGMVHIGYWVLLKKENRLRRKQGEKKIPYSVEWYEDDEEENPKIKHKYWW